MYFAYDLTKRNIAGDHEADVSAAGLSLKIRRFGPGAIFALIGAGLLAYAASHKATRTVEPVPNVTYSAAGDVQLEAGDVDVTTDTIGADDVQPDIESAVGSDR